MTAQFAEVVMRQRVRPEIHDGDETTRIEIDNVRLNVQMPNGVDALQGDAMAPVITTWLRNQP